VYSEILFACETVQHLNMPRKTACSEQQQQQVKFFSSNVTLLGRNRAGPAPATSGPMGYVSLDQFEMAPVVVPRGRRGASRHGFASASVALQESVRAAPSAPVSPKVDLKPASDVLAGAMARAASQSTIHPLDTLKVRMQHNGGLSKPGRVLSKFAKLVPPPQGNPMATSQAAIQRAIPKIAGLYRGVFGAASGAGIAIGAYFAFYGAATNLLVRHSKLSTGQIAFVAGAAAAAGGSVVKVPLAVCIRSVQAGVYPNVVVAAKAITAAAGPRGLFTGYLPTLLEDIPDMAFKFAAYESLRAARLRLMRGRKATVQEDFCMGAVSGAFAAAATTPLDVIKTSMMCTAASRPTMRSAAARVLADGGPKALFRGVGPRALSNGVNSAVFFMFFEALRAAFKERKAKKAAEIAEGSQPSAGRLLLSSRASSNASRALSPATA